MTSAVQLIIFIVGIGLLIFIHELGHFLAARLLNVEVEEFGIGFPPRLVKLFEAGGTAFTLNAIPLGGFVRPKGENDPSIPGGLAASSPWVRLAVLFAGPLMNLLTGVVLGALLYYSMGDPVLSQVTVDRVIAGSPAESAGLQPKDLFVSIEGQPIDSSEKLQEVVSSHAGQPLHVVVLRNGAEQTLTITPAAASSQDRATIGVYMTHPSVPISLGTSIYRGAYATVQNVREILLLPLRMIRGTASPDEGRLVGYKGMFEIYQQIPDPLWFFMAITISLGVFNLFPIPALDGGRILLTLPEILIRRRIPQQYENIIHLVGFTLLILFIIYVNVQDFLNPITLPK